VVVYPVVGQSLCKQLEANPQRCNQTKLESRRKRDFLGVLDQDSRRLNPAVDAPTTYSIFTQFG